MELKEKCKTLYLDGIKKKVEVLDERNPVGCGQHKGRIDVWMH